MFTYETELQLKPHYIPEISNIRIFQKGTGEQSGHYTASTGNNFEIKKKDFREDEHDPV
jgi:hypothetical protein